MKKAMIAMIEDNKIIRENIMKFIGFHEEFEVVLGVGSAESFFHEIKSNPKIQIDILLLDIGLPGISGLEALPQLLQWKPDLNVIVLSTYEEEDMILKALCSGACSYISKKASLSEIVEAIRIVLNGGSYMSPSIAREIINHLMGGRVSKASILSDRQKEILQKLVDGKSYQVISEELFISVETVRTHIKKMYKVLHVNNKTEAINMYMKGHIG
ncbi:DNA-binding response regulator [Runella rosea]|uniref:DNA-binding response regulator n=1 Tax=Runella rosea TaxID=2259595 RepID=A0A344TP25_9BACT|nr:response regulator transcription factor [Runella rosea]AXE20396.1 DNA-binding response regulator [Runella rosea]